MNRRVLSLAITAVALATTAACWCSPGPGEVLDLGITADLHAVAFLPASDLDLDLDHGSFVAVGSEGTVVAWGIDGFTRQQILFTETSLGELDLRAVWADTSNWWVIGDGGLAASSTDLGENWMIVDLAGSTANLRAITSTGSRLIVVGDDVVLVQAIDGSWTEATPPTGGWGDLRGVHYDGTRVYTAGLGGVMWSAGDPRGEWAAEAIGIDEDLFAMGGIVTVNDQQRVAAVGTRGTLLIGNTNGWLHADTGVDVDLIGYAHQGALGAGGEVFEIDARGKLSRVDTVAGARAFDYVSHDWIVVGDEGWILEQLLRECGSRASTVTGVTELQAVGS